MPRQYTPKVPRVCRFCGATFLIQPARINRGEGIYCSRRCGGDALTATFAERFWARVLKTDTCWIWQGFLKPNGYGKVGVLKKNVYAHRAAYMLTHGPIPKGMKVLHNCPGGDNPACVNPAHLWLGTTLDNTRDMIAKGRGAWQKKAKDESRQSA